MSIIKDLVDDNYRAEKVAKLEAYRAEGFVEGWNEAIEAAAKVCFDGGVGYPVTASQIRKLKK